MIIHCHPQEWYIDRLVNDQHFCVGRYGDAEWLAIFRDEPNRVNAEGTLFTPELCEALKQSLSYKNSSFYYSVPYIETDLTKLFGGNLDSVINAEFIDCQFWDTQVRLGGLVPFIKHIQDMKTCIISNSHLRRLDFLEYDAFIEVSYPNCFPELNRVIEEVKQLGSEYTYLVSAGMPATIFVQEIQRALGDVFALDLGSIWDAFVGIGTQRGWRKELYDNPKVYADWKRLYQEVGYV